MRCARCSSLAITTQVARVLAFMPLRCCCRWCLLAQTILKCVFTVTVSCCSRSHPRKHTGAVESQLVRANTVQLFVKQSLLAVLSRLASNAVHLFASRAGAKSKACRGLDHSVVVSSSLCYSLTPSSVTGGAAGALWLPKRIVASYGIHAALVAARTRQGTDNSFAAFLCSCT